MQMHTFYSNCFTGPTIFERRKFSAFGSASKALLIFRFYFRLMSTFIPRLK